MKSPFNVLVPTDYSDESLHVLEYAIHISEKLFSVVYILHSYQLPVYPQEMPSQAIDLELKDIEDEAKAKMTTLVENLQKKYNNATFISLVKYGPLETKMNEVINHKKIDLLILGSKGANAAEVFLFGSICADSIGNVRCPIIIVPKDSKTYDIKNIAFAASWLEEDDIKGIKNLLPLVKACQAKLTAVHAYSTKEFYSKEERRDYEAKIRKAVGYSHLAFKLIEGENFNDTVEGFVKEQDIDLLVMVTHPRFMFEGLFHPSFTKKVMRHINVPLLVFYNANL